MKPVNVVNGINLTEHGGLIGREVQRYRGALGGCLEWEDLFQVGWLGLHHAAQRFDPAKGFKFSTYAHWWIRAFLQRAIMNQRRTVRVPVHVQNAARQRGERFPYDSLSLDTPLNSENPAETWLDMLSGDSDPSADAEQSDLAELVGAAVDALDERNRRIIRRRFWRDNTLGEIGDDMGVSRERIRQREAQALERLERPLRALRGPNV